MQVVAKELQVEVDFLDRTHFVAELSVQRGTHIARHAPSEPKPRSAGGASSDACAAWTYFAPYCYWSLGCDKSLSDRATMWGAIAGMRSL